MRGEGELCGLGEVAITLNGDAMVLENWGERIRS